MADAPSCHVVRTMHLKKALQLRSVLLLRNEHVITLLHACTGGAGAHHRRSLPQGGCRVALHWPHGPG